MGPQPVPGEAIELLFEPIAIGGALARNRIALAPMTSCFAEVDGKVSDRLVSFLEARAKGGAGLVMTEGAAVDARGRGWTNHLSVYDDTFRPGLARLGGRHPCPRLPRLDAAHAQLGRRTVSAVTGVQPICRRLPGAHGRQLGGAAPAEHGRGLRRHRALRGRDRHELNE